MKILHILKHCRNSNGNVNVAVDLACIQSKNANEVFFASGGGDYEELLSEWGVQHLRIEQNQRKPFTLVKAVVSLFKLQRKYSFDVIHAHMMGGAVIGWIVSKFTGTPLITTVHNSFDWHSILMSLGKRVVAVSKAEKQFLLQKKVGKIFGPYKPEQVIVVLNGPNNSPRESFRKSADVKIENNSVITVCGLHKRKGVFDLINAFTKAIKNIDQPWYLYIAGGGPDELELKKLVKEIEMEHRIFFLGYVQHSKIFLDQAKIFVLASYAEPAGLVLAEARASRCALIATNVGGIPEMVDFGRAGELVEPGNPTQLGHAIHSLMIDENKLSMARIAAYEGSEYFNVDRMVEDYEKVYKQVCINKQAPYQVQEQIDGWVSNRANEFVDRVKGSSLPEAVRKQLYMSTDCAVCYVTDVNFMLPTLISAAGVRRFVSADKATIYIFAIETESERLKEINTFLAAKGIYGVEFIIMDKNCFTGIDWERANKTHVPLAALGRFFMDGLLPDSAKRIVYLDGDTWIKDDPSTLIETVFPEGKLAAVEDITFYCRNDITAHGKVTRSYLRALGIDGSNGYFNSGVFAAERRTWREISGEALNFFIKNTEACKFHDQSALNAVVGDRRMGLSPAWNFQTPYRYWNVDQKVNPAIYHFTQSQKPWTAPVEPWAHLFLPYEEKLASFAPLKLSVKRLSKAEIETANRGSRKLEQRLRWVYPVRLWQRRNMLETILQSSSLRREIAVDDNFRFRQMRSTQMVDPCVQKQ
jgi:glycosyltransferase involved in cell wall biosynthesis/lipopolysaccharide biosynthesis glycosyltransferase